jgi:hypothetical protein
LDRALTLAKEIEVDIRERESKSGRPLGANLVSTRLRAAKPLILSRNLYLSFVIWQKTAGVTIIPERETQCKKARRLQSSESL